MTQKKKVGRAYCFWGKKNKYLPTRHHQGGWQKCAAWTRGASRLEKKDEGNLEHLYRGGKKTRAETEDSRRGTKEKTGLNR